MNCVYLLQHTYFYGEHNEHEETKVIGIFDSRIKAQETINKYIQLLGFENFTIDCFSIDEYELNVSEWAEGFVE